MTILFFAIIFAAINTLRSLGLFSRVLACITTATITVLLSIILFDYSVIHLVDIFFDVFVGMFLGLVLGWGKYFAVFTGNIATIPESEVKPIDWLVNKLLGVPKTVIQLKWWSFLAFTLRGVLFYPMFFALAIYNPHSLLWGVGVLGMGIAFGLMNLVPEKSAATGGNLLYGGLLGALVALSL